MNHIFIAHRQAWEAVARARLDRGIELPFATRVIENLDLFTIRGHQGFYNPFYLHPTRLPPTSIVAISELGVIGFVHDPRDVKQCLEDIVSMSEYNDIPF